MDPYKVLGISGNASKDDAKKAFRKLAGQWHPDKHSDADSKKIAEEKFKEINNAWQLIESGNASASANTNASPHTTPPRQSYSPFTSYGNFDFSPDMGMDTGFRFSQEDINDILNDNARRSAFRNYKVYGAPNNGTLKIQIGIDKVKPGAITRSTIMMSDGSTETFELKLPDDVFDEQEIEYNVGGRVGRIHVILRVKPPKDHTMENRDLHYEYKIDGVTASIGGMFEYEHYSGRTFHITIPPGTENNAVIRMKGLGLDMTGSDEPNGDLYITFKVKMKNMAKYANAIRTAIAGVDSGEIDESIIPDVDTADSAPAYEYHE